MDQRPLNYVHIFTKKNNSRVREEAEKLNQFLHASKVETDFSNQYQETKRLPQAVFVLGGDGTFLSAVHQYAPLGIPLLGIDMGGLGFLAEVSVENMLKAVEKVLQGEFDIEERMMVECEIIHQDGTAETDFALNDVVIYRGPFAQMIRLSTYIDEEFLASFPADGLIVATPTGSSAYSLSAGGPVVFPTLAVFLITPICAHTLYARSIVVPPTSCVKVVLESLKEGTMVTLDGQRGYSLVKGEYLKVRKASFSVRLIKLLEERRFYSLLRSKLSWGMDIRKRVEQEC
ncbi:MAG: NAD(+)/NADH kinase [Candidatus Caldatribacteriaceae bacterium]